MIDQLLYTWADRGLEGRGRLQVVSATERLFNGPSQIRDRALALCRYSLPRSAAAVPSSRIVSSPDSEGTTTAPVSYGWLDLDGLRYAFRRSYLGTDPFGRPGVFAAHILVADADLLPADRLVHLMHSPDWWTGTALDDLAGQPAGSVLRTENGWLSPVSLDQFSAEPMPDTDESARAAVTAAVLAHRGQPVSLAVTADEFIAALAGTARAMPGWLDRISVSSYETPELATWFGLSGAGGPLVATEAITAGQLAVEPTMARCHRAAGLVQSTESAAQQEVCNAWDGSGVAWDGPGPLPLNRRRLNAFVDTCLVLAELRAGQVVGLEDLLPAMSWPRTARDLFDYGSVREVLATALAGHDDRVVELMLRQTSRYPDLESRASSAPLDSEALQDLGSRIGRRCRQLPGADLDSLVEVLRPLPGPIFAAFAETMLDGAERQPEVLAQWPAQLLVAACRRTSRKRTPLTLWNSLLQAGSRMLPQLSKARMADDLWASMLTRALTDKTIEPPAVLDFVGNSSDRAEAVFRQLPHHDLRHLFDRLTATEGENLLKLWTNPVDCFSYVEIAASVVDRRPPAEQWPLLPLVRSALGQRSPANWPPLVLHAVTSRLSYELDQPSESHRGPELYRLLDGTDHYELRSWRDYFRQLRQPEVSEELPHLIAQVAVERRLLAARYAFDVLISSAHSDGEVADIVSMLRPLLELDDATFVHAALVAGARPAKATTILDTPGELILAYLNQHYLKSGRSGRLGRSETVPIDDETQALITRIESRIAFPPLAHKSRH